MTTTIYRSTDAGAPDLSSTTHGSLLNILRACLITGYGTRPAKGWTSVFEDIPNNKIAIKSTTGTGRILRIDDSRDYRYAIAKTYATMSDIDTGTNEHPTIPHMNNQSGKEPRITKRTTAAVDQNIWTVIAGDDFFYFQSGTGATTGGFFFGDIECLVPDFHGRCVLGSVYFYQNEGSTSGGVVSGLTSIVEPYSNTQNVWIMSQSPEGFTSGYRLGSNSLADTANTYTMAPNAFTGKIDVSKVAVVGGTDKTIVGYLPNLFKVYGRSKSLVTGDLLSLDGVDYYAFVVSETVHLFRYDEI